MDILVLPDGVFSYLHTIKYNNKQVEVTLYFQPLEILRKEDGNISGYRIFKIIDIEKYYLGDKVGAGHELIYDKINVPHRIKTIFENFISI